MGFHNMVLGTESQSQELLSPAEAVAAIILVATATDGYLSEEDAYYISSILSRMKLFRNYPQDIMNRLFEKFLGILRRDGVNTLFNTAKESLSQELREAAFAVAADLILTSNPVNEEEINFLADLSQALAVSIETRIQVVQVMLLKNRG
ncbi:MAG: tellurite resistance TerB family protein [Gloeotrichia echinulata IR180]|jgi:hypothetical protein|nr:tellurite resistance TerB family protein [Gloeotrichia echinulata DEX184]